MFKTRYLINYKNLKSYQDSFHNLQLTTRILKKVIQFKNQKKVEQLQKLPYSLTKKKIF